VVAFSGFVERILESPSKRAKIRANDDFISPKCLSGLRLVRDNAIYEDDNLLVIDKPYGLAVQGGTGIDLSLDKILKNLSSGEEKLRLVHRLDRYTTGVLIIAKNMTTAKRLAKIFKRRENLRKEYLLVAWGHIHRDSGLIDYPLTKKYENNLEKVYVDRLGGQEALTSYRTLSYSSSYDLSFVKAEIITGRTHQIRVHFEGIGSPLLGDFKYGREDGKTLTSKLQLHSYRTTLNLFGREHVFVAEIPRHMEKVLDRVFPNWRELL
jgi:23S rRNA pseudouridine955/2504/2580 synthase